jgi:hypothetical protein
MHHKITTADVWESAFFLSQGAKIESIDCLALNGGLSCRVSFGSENLTELQKSYFSGAGYVEIFALRRAYSQIQSYIAEAKTKHKKEMKASQSQEVRP